MVWVAVAVGILQLPVSCLTVSSWGVGSGAPFTRRQKRVVRSLSGQRFAPPPSAADCLARDRTTLFTWALLWGSNGRRSNGARSGAFGGGGRWIIPAGVGLLEASGVCQRDEAAVSDHYVVDDANSHRAADGGELLCDGAIFGGGGGIS